MAVFEKPLSSFLPSPDIMCQHCAHGDDGWADLVKYDETYAAAKSDDENSKNEESDSDSEADSSAHQSVRTTST